MIFIFTTLGLSCSYSAPLSVSGNYIVDLCVFQNCHNPGSGGSIAGMCSRLEMKRSTFTDSTSGAHGAVLFLNSGSSVLYIYCCCISRYDNSHGHGGKCSLAYPGTSFTFDLSTVHSSLTDGGYEIFNTASADQQYSSLNMSKNNDGSRAGTISTAHQTYLRCQYCTFVSNTVPHILHDYNYKASTFTISHLNIVQNAVAQLFAQPQNPQISFSVIHSNTGSLGLSESFFVSCLFSPLDPTLKLTFLKTASCFGIDIISEPSKTNRFSLDIFKVLLMFTLM